MYRDFIKRNRTFVVAYLGQSASRFGNYVYIAGVGLVAYDLSGSVVLPAQLAMLFASLQMLLLPVGGVVVDYLKPQKVMLWTDGLSFLVILGMAVAVINDFWQVPSLIVGTAMQGVLASVFMPAYRTVIPDLVPREDLLTANAFTGVLNTSAMVLGPVVGGSVATLLGAEWCLVLNAVTFGIAMVTLIPTLSIGLKHEPGLGILHELRRMFDGLTALYSTPDAVALVLPGFLLAMTAESVLSAGLPTFAAWDDSGDWIVGVTGGAVAIGLALSSALLPRIAVAKLLVYRLAQGFAPALIALGVMASNTYLWLCLSFLYGACASTRYVRYAMLPEMFDRSVLGKVMAADLLISLSGLVVGGGIVILGRYLGGSLGTTAAVGAVLALSFMVWSFATSRGEASRARSTARS